MKVLSKVLQNYRLARTTVTRSATACRPPMHSFPIDEYHDKDHPAHKFGYRVSTPVRHSSTVSVCEDSSLFEPPINPASLDILNSPEVRAILDSQREWDASLDEEQTVVWAIEEEETEEKVDPYFSDHEAKKDSWEHETSLDEKPM